MQISPISMSDLATATSQINNYSVQRLVRFIHWVNELSKWVKREFDRIVKYTFSYLYL